MCLGQGEIGLCDSNRDLRGTIGWHVIGGKSLCPFRLGTLDNPGDDPSREVEIRQPSHGRVDGAMVPFSGPGGGARGFQTSPARRDGQHQQQQSASRTRNPAVEQSKLAPAVPQLLRTPFKARSSASVSSVSPAPRPEAVVHRRLQAKSKPAEQAVDDAAIKSQGAGGSSATTVPKQLSEEECVRIIDGADEIRKTGKEVWAVQQAARQYIGHHMLKFKVVRFTSLFFVCKQNVSMSKCSFRDLHFEIQN